MIGIQELLDTLGACTPEGDVGLVRKAYVYAESAHAGQTLRCGAPYISRPLAVADTLARLRLDATTVAAGLLHHTVVADAMESAIKDIKAVFGEEVAVIVEGAATIGPWGFTNQEGRRDGNSHKMLLAVSKDLRALAVKLADRLHTMRALANQPPSRQQRTAQETMDVYVPLAKSLGLHCIERELEDLCFRYTRPEEYFRISDRLEERRSADEEYIREVTGMLRGILDGHGMQAALGSRIKRVSGIFHAIAERNLDLDEVPGLIVFRIIVKDKQDCYTALGLLHTAWKFLPGRFRDYIAAPKPNGYQGLHATMIGPRGERLELRIRTEEMDRRAENGPVSHWDAEVHRRLRKLLGAEYNPYQIVCQPPDNWIYVFTPKGAVRELPKGVTPVDFAYAIHTEVGNRCVGVKVNGRLAPLNTELRSGDSVEIITSAKGRPSRNWLAFAKTAKTRARIRRFFRAEERGTAPGGEAPEK